MLDSILPVTSLGKNSTVCSGDLLCEYNFCFKIIHEEKPIKYTIIFSEYIGNIFVAKFFPTQMSNDEDRFSIVFKYGNKFSSTVIATVLDCMMKMAIKHPRHSFGFIGAQRIKKIIRKDGVIFSKEKQENTRRHSLYLRICKTKINPKDFYTSVNKKRSAILMINCNVYRTKEDSENYKMKMEKMFNENYPEFAL